MPDLSSVAMKEMAEQFMKENAEGFEPAADMDDFCLDKVDFEYVAKCKNKKELVWIIKELEEDGGFPQLLDATKKTLYDMDPKM